VKLNKTLLFLFLSVSVYAQDFSDKWTGYFSYLDIRDISSGNDRIIAAAQNAVFEYDPITQTTEKTDAIDGLEGSDISAIYYSETFNQTLIGHESGLIQIILENNGQVFTVVDILNKITIAPDDKRINHFLEHENKIYISTEFGVAEYDLENLEFGESFFIGQNGDQIEVTQTAVLDSRIYAASKH
jgi:hypothetical protein